MKSFYLTILIVYLIHLAQSITLTPGPVKCEYKNKDKDVKYDAEKDVLIKCDGTTCTVRGSGAAASNGLVTISKAGVYIIEGSLNGQLRISGAEDDYFHLVLNGVDIISNNGPAIYVVNAKKVTITLVGENNLADSKNYTVVNEEPDACLFVDADLSINGSGSVNVAGYYADAIRCKKDLRIMNGQITISSAVAKGIKAKNSICIKDGTIGITSSDTGIKVTRSDDAMKGYAVIDGGRISISSNKDGIHAETHVTINGGFIDIRRSSEGIEGQMIDIVDGEIHISSTDDAINASKAESTINGATEANEEVTVNDRSIYINIIGGKTYTSSIATDVDGVDPNNGILYVGGKAELYVSVQGGAVNGLMDSLKAGDSNAIVSKASVIATAGGGKIEGGTDKIYQNYILTSVTAQYGKTPITVKDGSGQVVLTYTPPISYSTLLITSPKLNAGETYTIETGTDTKTEQAVAGTPGTVDSPSLNSPEESSSNTSSKSSNKDKDSGSVTFAKPQIISFFFLLLAIIIINY